MMRRFPLHLIILIGAPLANDALRAGVCAGAWPRPVTATRGLCGFFSLFDGVSREARA
jgi:hypothetical protein